MVLHRLAAITLIVVSVGATVAAAWAEGAARSTALEHPETPIALALAGVGVGLSWFGVGLILAWLRPRNLLGWLLLTVGTATQVGIAEEALALAGTFGVVDPAEPWAARSAGLILSALGGLAIYLLIGLLPVLYPSGMLPNRHWSWPSAVVITGAVALQSQWLLAELNPGWTWPADPTPPATSGPEIWIPVVVYVLGVLAVWALCVVRLVRSRRPERQQLAWLLAAVGAVVGANIAGASVIAQWAQLLTLYLLPAAIAVGLLRYGLLGIDVPPRVDPMRTLSELGDRVAVTDEHQLLDAVLAGVGGAVRASGGRVLDVAGGELAVFGDASTPVGFGSGAGTGFASGPVPACAVDLFVGGTPVGRLELSGRVAGGRYTGREQRMISAMAAQLAAVVRAVQLASELAAGRDAVMRARHTERDRLRREIHDGLGPSLAGVTLGLRGVRDALAAGEGSRALDIAEVLSDEMGRAVTDVRRILDELAPAALVEQGLLWPRCGSVRHPSPPWSPSTCRWLTCPSCRMPWRRPSTGWSARR
ncbi:histidine kinase dimerization/phosphoacceptor domain-containing protein [Salinibacterium sp. ZJ454]|uniref:histidine kinase dimerization/phosphoacceptor domain-containing protein n=1 Tax=Salinibacterium sp. ZJ454 TaxID=2708339 RepID=UPI001422A7CC|nr:histidine kinase dimerization/phosphoacceptor domain-containing protein [Salinibacterium sp. ZJ454]